MKKLFAIGFIPLFLAGCAKDMQTTLTKTDYKVIEPPAQFFDCDKRKVIFPIDVDTLTDQQVANYIIKLTQALNECQVDARSARQYVADAKKIIAKPKN